jgi:hypothetical protein
VLIEVAVENRKLKHYSRQLNMFLGFLFNSLVLTEFVGGMSYQNMILYLLYVNQLNRNNGLMLLFYIFGMLRQSWPVILAIVANQHIVHCTFYHA